MKKGFERMLRALALAMMMTFALTVNSLAVCTQFRVNASIRREYTAYRDCYVTIRNVSDSGSCTVKINGGESNKYCHDDRNTGAGDYSLGAHKYVTRYVKNGNKITFNLNMNGNGTPYVVISGYVS